MTSLAARSVSVWLKRWARRGTPTGAPSLATTRVAATRGLYARAYGVHAASTQEVKKAALMIIGDEILSGSIQDTNTPWLANFLRARGALFDAIIAAVVVAAVVVTIVAAMISMSSRL